MADIKTLRALRRQYLEKLLDTIKLEFSDSGFNLTWRTPDMGWAGTHMGWLHGDPINVSDTYGQFKENPGFSIVISGYAQDDCLADFNVNRDLKVIEKFVVDIIVNFFNQEPYPIEGKRIELTNWSNHIFDSTDILVEPEFVNHSIGGIGLTISLRERQ